MQSKPLFYLILLALLLIGAWGVRQIERQDGEHAQESEQLQQGVAGNPYSDSRASVNTEATFQPGPQSLEASTESNFDFILQLINSSQALAAANSINANYSSLSATELDSLKSELLNLAFQTDSNNASRAKNVLLATSTAFDELIVWKYLGDAAVSDTDWNTAFNAYFRASQLENNSIDLELLLTKLMISSGHLRSNYEGNGDLLSVKRLYQNLSDSHPNYQRFKYELAASNLKLGDVESAKPLLQQLIYDPELGELSKQALAQIKQEAEGQRETEPNDLAANKYESRTRVNDIVVPLISSGSSFLVDSVVERKPTRLLLDTGASITSLSKALIERLQLEPTGQSIRLSTANGLTNARIYRVEQLQLGSLVLRNMLIAEINLIGNRRFQGLLGTDALNQLKPQYSYVIDNQERALIFRKK